MWSIPISHFTRVAGHFSQASLGGVVYITINVFVMQAMPRSIGICSCAKDGT